MNQANHLESSDVGKEFFVQLQNRLLRFLLASLQIKLERLEYHGKYSVPENYGAEYQNFLPSQLKV